MKKIILSTFLAAVFLCGVCSCSSFLDIEPKDRITADDLLQSDGGINAYMAGMYFNIPIEDFRYDFTKEGTEGFNICRTDGGKNNMMAGPEATHSEWGDHIGETNRFNNWESIYKYIRGFNELKANIPLMKPSSPATIDRVTGEYYFMMAYAYFALAKRYGGVPIIENVQDFNGDYEAVKVPRSTEVDTWKFVLKMCDNAANYLPDEINQTRATKWTALALKSRAALFAASVGKFWNRDGAALTGQAVDQKLVGGFTQQDIDYFYEQCISASAAVIGSGKFFLNGGENPASLDQASENYRKVFIEPSGMSEVIFMRAFTDPGITHNFGKWHEPNQLAIEYGGRCCPTLNLVESYAKIDANGNAVYDQPLVTLNTGDETYGTWNKWEFNNKLDYKVYDNLNDIFANRDPRLYASVILPGTEWSGTDIVIQGGIRKAEKGSDGNYEYIWKNTDNTAYEFNGTTYYSKGASESKGYSGWVTNMSNGTITGFCIKKYLRGSEYDQIWDKVTTPFVDIRYAEVLLNYAEAIAESGLPANEVMTGEEALNKTHHRAGFKDNLTLTTENVRRERKSEMALQYDSIWDYWRRRELHTIFDNANQRQGLVPMLDFTTGSQKYIFVRANIETGNSARHFEEKAYYRPIPGIAGNSLIQNPNY